MRVKKIISGGQTGADRAALDFAIANGFEMGGYVPKGRTAEDGRISDLYKNLIETGSGDPAERTELNVANSDATLIVSHGEISGGTSLTADCAHRYGKPLLHIDLNIVSTETAAEKIRNWIDRNGVGVVNVAGPRASEDPAIYDAVVELLQTVG